MTDDIRRICRLASVIGLSCVGTSVTVNIQSQLLPASVGQISVRMAGSLDDGVDTLEACQGGPATSFTYSCLRDPRSIRLLTLIPGSGSQLQCYLTEVSLDSDPDYEALSYTWATEDGDRSASQLIFVNNHSLLITRNCEAALRRFRLPHEKRVVWVDAICIDQEHKTEVQLQVTMMRDIYRKSRQTII